MKLKSAMSVLGLLLSIAALGYALPSHADTVQIRSERDVRAWMQRVFDVGMAGGDLNPYAIPYIAGELKPWLRSKPRIHATAVAEHPYIEWDVQAYLYGYVVHLIEVQGTRSRTVALVLKTHEQPVQLAGIDFGVWRDGVVLQGARSLIETDVLIWRKGGVAGGAVLAKQQTGRKPRPKRAPRAGSPRDGYWSRMYHNGSGEDPIAISPDGRLLAATTGRPETSMTGVGLWELKTRRFLRFLPGSGVASLAFSPDSRFLATGRFDETVTLWDVGTGKVAWKIRDLRSTEHPNAPRGARSVAFTPSGEAVVTAGWEGMGRVEGDPYVRWWSAATGTPTRKLRGRLGGWSPDGNWLAVENEGRITLVAAVGLPSWSRPADRFLAFTSDGLHGLRDGKLVYFNMAGGEVPRALDAATYGAPSGLVVQIAGEHPHYVMNLMDPSSGTGTVLSHDTDQGIFPRASSPDGRLLITGDMQGKAWVWKAASGELLLSYDPGTLDFAFSPDGRFVVANGWDGRIQILDLETGKTVGTLRVADAAR